MTSHCVDYVSMVGVTEERDLMVRQQIEPWNVSDPKVLEAFRTVPRENFLPEKYKYQAYHDKSIDVMNVELLPPKVLAKMFQALDISHGERLLLVGIGLGYSFAIAHQLTPAVLGLEIDIDILEIAKSNLSRAKVPLDGVYHQDGHQGFADLGPFDKIMFTAAFDIYPPESLFAQLSNRGKCFFFYQGEGVQHGTLVERSGQSFNQSLSFESFVPFLKNTPRNTTFVL